MNAKILLIAISAAAFASCSTAYKSGQTPDDVYYSPVRAVDETRNDDRRDDTRPDETTANDTRVRMVIRDYRWRDFDNDYDYSYRHSPYGYCYGSYNNYGYYYNPYYYSRPLYNPKANYYSPVVNSTPRMVNLNSYKNYTAAVNNNPKAGGNVSNSTKPVRQYNNNNSGDSRFGRIVRQVFTPSNNTNTNTNTNSSTDNNTRTYTPSTNSSTPSSSSSSSSSSGSSVARPGRGGGGR
jgi:hypothetical protein